MSSFIQTNQTVLLPNANYTVSSADTGKLMLVPILTVGGDKTITLPAVTAGLHYRFMAIGLIGAIGTIQAVAGVGILQGALLNTNVGAADVTTLVVKNNAVAANFTATAPIGTYIDAYCDGTNWHVSGMSRVTAGLS